MSDFTYDDIVFTDWKGETERTPMSLNQRAKIFLPFSALTGYEQALNEALIAEIEGMEFKSGGFVFDDL